MTEIDEALKSKIKKLLRLAESDNPNEAALAAQRAQELMLRHGIEQDELSFDEPLEIGESEAISPPTGKMPSWKARLATIVAKANGCTALTLARFAGEGPNGRAVNHRRLVLLGNKKKLTAVAYFYRLLEEEVERFAYAFQGSKTARLSYRHGLLDTIANRLYAALRTVDEQTGGAALVLINKERTAIDAYLKEKQIGKARAAFARDAAAREQGRRDGHKVNMQQGLEAGTSHRQLGKGA